MRSLALRRILLLSTPLALFVSSAQAAVGGYWRFEEGTAGVTAVDPILDSSGNANNGTPIGDPTYSSLTPDSFPAANNLSLNFDGSGDVVEIPHSASLAEVNTFTVEFWMRSAGTGAGQDLLVDKSHGFTDSTGWVFQSMPGNGDIFFGGWTRGRCDREFSWCDQYR